MTNSEFLSKANVYDGEYSCLLRTPQNEMVSRMHYHDFYEFVIYLGAAGTFRILNGEYLIKRGDIVLIDMFTPHTLVNTKTNYYERFSVIIDPSLLISFSTPTSNLLDLFNEAGAHHRILHIEEQDFRKYITLLEEYQNVKLKNGRDVMEKAMIHHLLAYIYSDGFEETMRNDTSPNQLSIITQLIRYIDEHLNEKVALSQLAQHVGYSEYYICHLFKKFTNKTLLSYIQEKRIEQAAVLIKRGASANQAAEQVGFNNYSYFYKIFKKLKGCAPANYREEAEVA